MNLGADLLVLLRDFGVPVSAGGRSAKALLDSYDETVLQGGAPSNLIGRQVVLTLRTGDLAVNNGDQIVINGAMHRVAETYALDDGLLTRLICMRGA